MTLTKKKFYGIQHMFPCQTYIPLGHGKGVAIIPDRWMHQTSEGGMRGAPSICFRGVLMNRSTEKAGSKAVVAALAGNGITVHD